MHCIFFWVKKQLLTDIWSILLSSHETREKCIKQLWLGDKKGKFKQFQCPTTIQIIVGFKRPTLWPDLQGR